MCNKKMTWPMKIMIGYLLAIGVAVNIFFIINILDYYGIG